MSLRIHCSSAALVCFLSNLSCGLSADGCLDDAECADGETCVLAGAGSGGRCRRGDEPALTGAAGRGGLPVFSRRDGGAEPGAAQVVFALHERGPAEGVAAPRSLALGEGAAPAGDGGATLPGERCENAETLVVPGTRSGTTLGYASDYGPRPGSGDDDEGNRCITYVSGPERAYVAVVPAGRELKVRLTIASTFPATLLFVAGPASRCAAREHDACLGGDIDGSTSREVKWKNEGDAPAQVYVLIESRTTGAGGDYFLEASFN